MTNVSRPFDVKPAAQCMTCGTPIAGGGYCLQCEPLSAHLGDDAWVRFRWFSGRRAEAEKRAIALRETINRAFVGTIAIAVAIVLVGQLQIQNPHLRMASNADQEVHRKLRDVSGAKRPLNPVTIS